jgi:hypothetical protein
MRSKPLIRLLTISDGQKDTQAEDARGGAAAHRGSSASDAAR